MQVIRWMTGLLLLMLLLGCVQEPSRALKVATTLWPGYEPLYLARTINAYQRNIDVIQLASSAEVIRALRNGSVDVAATTLDEVLQLKAQGEDLVVLLVLNFSSGADAVLARPPIKSLSEIQGMRIGVENSGVGAVMLSAVLQHAQLQRADIQRINVPVFQHVKAYQDNRIDVLVTHEPFATQLRAAGANLLFDSSAAPDLIMDVLIVRSNVFEKRKDELRDLVRGYYRAREFMSSRPLDANDRISRRLRVPVQDMQRMWSGLRLPSLQDNIQWLDGSPSPFDKNVVRLERLMRSENLLAQHTEGRLRVHPGLLKQVEP